ncbi:hypothetical protein KJ742_07340 [Patescibacteria group bacterium]|nr:hypothetical protein [Patescibacteria group bacterium]MBU1683724.1 hypothetical protein [Patescibacteria group bacterium]MBU1935527.1 hypothetical protein [Patescibacteria group bacterium]
MSESTEFEAYSAPSLTDVREVSDKPDQLGATPRAHLRLQLKRDVDAALGIPDTNLPSLDEPSEDTLVPFGSAKAAENKDMFAGDNEVRISMFLEILHGHYRPSEIVILPRSVDFGGGDVDLTGAQFLEYAGGDADEWGSLMDKFLLTSGLGSDSQVAFYDVNDGCWYSFDAKTGRVSKSAFTDEHLNAITEAPKPTLH